MPSPFSKPQAPSKRTSTRVAKSRRNGTLTPTKILRTNQRQRQRIPESFSPIACSTPARSFSYFLEREPIVSGTEPAVGSSSNRKARSEHVLTPTNDQPKTQPEDSLVSEFRDNLEQVQVKNKTILVCYFF